MYVTSTRITLASQVSSNLCNWMLYVLRTNYVVCATCINLKINYHQVSLTTTTKNTPIITTINQDLPEQLHLLENPLYPPKPLPSLPRPLTPPITDRTSKK